MTLVRNMPIKFLRFTMNRSNISKLIVCFLIVSCAFNKDKNQGESVDDDYFSKTHVAECEPGSKPVNYKIGDLPCLREILPVNSNEKLEIHFVVTDKDSDDPYEYGYQELLRYKNGKIIEKMKLRVENDPYWSIVPFVRIRKQKYLADLDNDGFLEFSMFPFHPGSAIWGTVRIFSLKDKIEFWGEGRYQFEGDNFVQLNCMKCSKFNSEECKKCE